MTPLLRGQKKVAAISADELRARASALGDAVDEGGEELQAEPAAVAAEVAAKVEQRLGLVGGHTVVALAGATGSGKSSIFNALVGDPVATVGARRPTTATPTSAVWGADEAGPLLDWLQVGRRHTVRSEFAPPPPAGSLDGLVLLDLPDFDSREVTHRAEAERVLELVDVFVWVTDPQKYADARLHDEYVSRLRAYGAVTIVVLNQADRLAPEALSRVTSDLERLVALDGIEDATIIPTSTLGGNGLETLRERLAVAVSAADAARHRLAADVTRAAEGLRASVGTGEPEDRELGTDELVDALATSAGIPTVVDAVRRDFKLESTARTGWPFTRWVSAFRPRPLKRFRVDTDDGVPRFDAADVRTVLGRSSLPPPTPAARANVELATRRVGDRASAGLPSPWAIAVVDAATPPEDALADELDQAVLRTSLRGKKPMWWGVLGLLQIVLAFAAILGLLWLVAIAVAGWLQLPELPTPQVGPFAWPFVLLVGGLVLGLTLAWLARWLADLGAERRANQVDKRLRRAVKGVSDERVIEPIRVVLDRHRRTRLALQRAL